MIKVENIELVFEEFPNGETRLPYRQLLFLGRNPDVEFKYQTDSDLIKLMFVKKYLDTIKSIDKVNLIIYYMPYSRMDRSENDSPFTLKYVTEFINGLKFDSVTVIEPHSDVTPALLDNVKSDYINFKLIDWVKDDVRFNEEEDYIMFPDLGASKRYSKMKVRNELIGHKHRDFQTGEIQSLEVLGTAIHKPNKVIIVDDLSSYGGTFIYSAEALKDLGFKEIYLLVAHAEDSIFKGKLFRTGYIDAVFTTNSLLSEDAIKNNNLNNLTVYDVKGAIYQ